MNIEYLVCYMLMLSSRENATGKWPASNASIGFGQTCDLILKLMIFN